MNPKLKTNEVIILDNEQSTFKVTRKRKNKFGKKSKDTTEDKMAKDFKHKFVKKKKISIDNKHKMEGFAPYQKVSDEELSFEDLELLNEVYGDTNNTSTVVPQELKQKEMCHLELEHPKLQISL